jgi:excisionase family DNA binding protein
MVAKSEFNAPAAGDDDALWTVAQVAEYLKLRTSTIYAWVQEHKIPGIKIGRSWRFQKSVILAWVGECARLTQEEK